MNPVNRVCVSCMKPFVARESLVKRCMRCRNMATEICMRAGRTVARAVKAGELKPARECKCVDCGAPATEYEHRDYSRPLDVDPTCHRCNLRRGPAAPIRLFA